MANKKQSLREMRLEKGFTQEALARALNVSLRNYQRWERGEHAPKDLTLVGVEEFLRKQPLATAKKKRG